MDTTRLKATVVFAIAPHLSPKHKKQSLRRPKRLPLSTLNPHFMPHSRTESDPPLSDDSGIRDGHRQDLAVRVQVDAQGDEVLLRGRSRVYDSDSSSYGAFSQPYYLLAMTC